MSRRSPILPSSGHPARWPGLLLLLAAFATGSAVTWMILRSSVPAPAPLLSGLSATPAAAEPLPDVSHLPPAQAAAALGNWNYDQKNWPHAIEHYQQALALGLDNADLRTDLGNCYRFTARPEKALEEYATAQRENPQHENSLLNTAGLYGEVLRDPAKAAATWREFLRRFPNSPAAGRARAALAEAAQHQQHQAGALRQFLEEDVAKQ